MATETETKEISPNETVYVRNLNEKIKIPELKESLKSLFSKYGNVVDVIAHKNIRMRGQAFVVYDSVDSAEKALKELNQHEIHGKPMSINFAQSKSDVTVQRQTPEEFDKHKQERLAKKEVTEKIFDNLKSQSVKRKASGKSQQGSKKSKVINEVLPPNKLLLLQNLPPGIQSQTLEDIYEKYNGFIEVRLVAIRRVAFVEFRNEEDAIKAKEETAGLKLDGSDVVVNYAKK